MNNDINEPGVTDGHESGIPPDVYRALSAQPRRRVVAYLLETQEATVEELAEVLCGWNLSDTSPMATAKDHETMQLRLVHLHLPLLEDVGLLAYDHDNGDVQMQALDSPLKQVIRESITRETEAE